MLMKSKEQMISPSAYLPMVPHKHRENKDIAGQLARIEHLTQKWKTTIQPQPPREETLEPNRFITEEEEKISQLADEITNQSLNKKKKRDLRLPIP